MSNISLVYQDLIDLTIATYPTHKELINAYIPELNDDLTMEAAWGLALAPGLNSKLYASCQLSIERDFMLTLTRKIMAGGLNRSSGTISTRRAAEKALLEDQYLMINNAEKNSGLPAVTKITNFTYETDGGIEFVRTEEVNLIMIKTIFKVKYEEVLT